MDARHAAVTVLTEVLRRGRSLSGALPGALEHVQPARDRALTQALCYGALRWYPRLEALLHELLERPLKTKDSDVYSVLLIGLYQLIYQRTPDHAAVAESVRLGDALGKPWARGLINGVLRRYIREAGALAARVDRGAAARLAHPAWLLRALQEAWPAQWEAIALANNAPPPMTLRVNARHGSRTAYLGELAAAGLGARAAAHAGAAITLTEPSAVERLPGFAAGHVSVQDAAAQLAAAVLAAAPGDRVLDACAAPGGKTAHILETQPELGELVALDIDAERMAQVADNLQRLQLSARLLVGDASDPEAWWNGTPFDRILLDAPCSASGVIRRHPDIKVLRRPDDIPALVERQRCILNKLWPLLRPGGRLVYATCSVLPQENTRQISEFLRTHDEARLLPLDVAWGHATEAGRQILPGEDEMDGFFYASLQKQQ